MQTMIKNALVTGLMAVLISSIVGCIYYRRVDPDGGRRDRYYDRDR
jgi:hypothetical protein